MTRLPIIAAAVLAIAGSVPIVCVTTNPASAAQWGDSDESADVRDLLRDQIRSREDLRELLDLLHERREMRGRMHERMSSWRDRDEDEEDEDRGGRRERLRERLAERMMERHGDEGGGCFFLTRSLRDEDGDFLVIIRRRICRD
jgi:hypothetical protein